MFKLWLALATAGCMAATVAVAWVFCRELMPLSRVIDLLGGAVFLLPMCIVMIWFTWPWFVQSWTLNEASKNAGGLIRWPVLLLLPVGFTLILLQGISEMIKRAAALRGFLQHEYAYEKPLQ